MVNGKFYHLGLGSKKYPLHFLIPHGAFQVRNVPALKHNDLLSWFEDCREGKIEGIVWHCGDGCLLKVMTETACLGFPSSQNDATLRFSGWIFINFGMQLV